MILAGFLWMFSLGLYAQDKPDSDLNFMIGKIREAYAGYADKIDPATYDQLVRNVQQSKLADTFANYSQLTGFFRDDHLEVFQVVTLGPKDSVQAVANLQTIRAGSTAHHNRGKNEAGIDKADKDKAMEGYWLDDLHHSILYLRKTGKEEWRGYVVETKDKAPAGYEVLRLTPDTGGRWLADYKDMSGPYRVITGAHFRTPQVLVGGSYFKYKKIGQYVPGMLARLQPFSYDPSITPLDSQTVLVRMPDFGGYEVKVYDSLIKANFALLSRARTLIIDVRDNAGGTIRCFKPLFPLIWTNPIYEIHGLQLCSQAVIDEARGDYASYQKANDTARAARMLRLIDTLERNKDSFRLTGGGEFPVVQVPNSVRHVALVMDHGSRSAAELMALYFRQSKKVTFFGENTGGAVDYLDLLIYWLPHTHFQFWLAGTKRQITTDQPRYDGIGIPPDVPISDDVSDWIDYVRKYYGKLDHTDKKPGS